MQALSLDEAFKLAEGRPLARSYPAPAHAYPNGLGPAERRSNLSVGDLLRESMQDIINRTRPSSHKARQCQTNRLLRTFGHLRAQDLQPDQLELYARDRKREVSDTAVKSELALISRAYNLAIENGQILTNPWDRAKKRIKLKPRKRVQVLSHESEEALRKAYLFLFGTEGEELWLHERFAILTGLRVGEQAHLQPVHFQTPGYVQVPEEGKTGTRPVPLCKEAARIARHFLARCLEHGHEYLFWPSKKADRVLAAQSHVRRRGTEAQMDEQLAQFVQVLEKRILELAKEIQASRESNVRSLSAFREQRKNGVQP